MRGRTIAARLLVVGCALAPAIADARTPLPTLEVVQPKKKRVRLLDVRWAAQVGYGYSIARRTHALTLGHEAQISFVELSKAAQLHVAFGMSGLVDPRYGWQDRTSMLGVDAGLGLSRHVAGGPALVATATVGPRWEKIRSDFGADITPDTGFESLRVDGWGVVGRIDAYPFYMTIPEILEEDRGWFREYVLSGVHLWAAARYDVLRTGRGPTIAAGLGLDIARMLLTPIVVAGTR